MMTETDCTCEYCTGTGHCAGNKWLPIVDHGARRRLCPCHSDLPLRHLRRKKILAVGQADDLRFDNGSTRLWLSRCGTEDGEPYADKVTVETFRSNGKWEIYREYLAV